MDSPSRDNRGLLQVRSGYSPNCSSYGSVVGIAMTSAALAAVVVNMWADRFAAWLDDDPPDDDEPDGTGGSGGPDTPPPSDPTPDTPTLRVESFGGILGWPDGQILIDHGAARVEHARQPDRRPPRAAAVLHGDDGEHLPLPVGELD